MNAMHFRTVIEACFPEFTVRTIAFLAEGWDSTVWDVNGTHVFRFPKRVAVAAGLLKEMSLLPALAPFLPVAIPQLEFAWRGGPACESVFVGYPKIAGVMLTDTHWRGMAAQAASPTGSALGSTGALEWAVTARPPAVHATADLASAAARPLARQLGAFLTALHSHPPQRAIDAGVSDGTPASWRRQYQALYETVLERVFPLLDSNTRATAAAGWADFLANDTMATFRPVLIHGDLGMEHILFDPSLGRLTGVLDWEDASIGDPALDFAGLLANLGIDAVEEVLDVYDGPVDAGLLVRAAFYRATAPFHEVLYGLETGLSEHVEAGLRAARAEWK